MNDCAVTIAEPEIPLPPILRAELTGAPLSPRPWYLSIAPAYLGLFVWAPFFDQLWVGDLPRGDLSSLFGSAVAASALCFCLFYWAASWGLAARRPLGIVAASTFGTAGSECLTGVAIAVANIVWYALAIDWAVDTTLLGLRACHLIAPEDIAGWRLGAVDVKSPVYLCTAVFWIYITGTSALWKMTGVIAALMRNYVPVAVLLLTAVALWMLPNLGSYRVADAVSIAQNAHAPSQFHDSALPMMVGFFALAGLTSVDWGSHARGRRDLVLGGLTGIVVAASWTAGMSLVVVAGAVARLTQAEVALAASVADPLSLSFRWAVFYGIGGVPCAVILILFALAALAPACYSVGVFGEILSIRWPRLRQWGWTWIGGAIAVLLSATSSLNRQDLIFSVMGVVFSPIAGAMCGDWLRQRGGWSGLRHGVNKVGIIACAAGWAIALILESVRVSNPGPVAWRLPAALVGFATSVAAYWLLARFGPEPTFVRLSQPDIDQ